MNNLSSQIGALELNHVAAGFDGALEAVSGATAQPSNIYHPGQRCVGDGALELAARESIAGPRTQHFPGGPCY